MTGTRSVCIKICGVAGMDGALLRKVLDSAGRFKSMTGCVTYPRYFNEATERDDFVDVIERQFDLGLTFDSFWFPTNGAGLARLDHSGWKRLAATGFSWLRLAFHGIGQEHDAFLGRQGAWNDLKITARKAEEHGMDWFPVVFLNRHNATRYEEIRSAIEQVGSPSLQVGWMVPNWQNRPEYDINRATVGQVARLIGEWSIWRSEGDVVRMVESDGLLASTRAFNMESGIHYLGCLPNGDVFYAGGCHGEPFTEHRKNMVLGSFHEHDDLGFFLEKALSSPPKQAAALSEVTFGELSKLFGDPASDMVYRTQDLMVNKWGSQYLRRYETD